MNWAGDKALKVMYTDTCDVYERQQVFDEDTKQNRFEEVCVLESQCCRVSFKSIYANDDSDNAAALSQSVKLFTPPDVVIRPGSKVIVHRGESSLEYSASGKSAEYPSSHCETMLEIFKRWA
jgi:hypothetical protein